MTVIFDQIKLKSSQRERELTLSSLAIRKLNLDQDSFSKLMEAEVLTSPKTEIFNWDFKSRKCSRRWRSQWKLGIQRVIEEKQNKEMTLLYPLFKKVFYIESVSTFEQNQSIKSSLSLCMGLKDVSGNIPPLLYTNPQKLSDECQNVVGSTHTDIFLSLLMIACPECSLKIN